MDGGQRSQPWVQVWRYLGLSCSLEGLSSIITIDMDVGQARLNMFNGDFKDDLDFFTGTDDGAIHHFR